MTRRAAAHDYSRPGTYHITLHVAEGRGCPLGTVVGDPMAADGTPEAPRVDLSPVGQMVKNELLTAVCARYPMVEVQEHVVMPDHLHALVRVTAPLKNKAGKSTHLGMVVKGFKYGCNRRYWQLLGLPTGHRPTESTGTVSATRVSADSVGGGYPSLFQEGYCDVMPVDAAQLETQRAYILGNPRSRLLRLSHRDWLTTQRGAIPTALTRPAGQEIVCDSYGDRSLLEKHLLPVVCHRKDKTRFAEQKRRCLKEAQREAVLVSPRIAKGEDITVAECKTMNCVAQALSRQKDDWWKDNK